MGEAENPRAADMVARRPARTLPSGERSPVVLSDDAVVLRPWSPSDANFMAEA